MTSGSSTATPPPSLPSLLQVWRQVFVYLIMRSGFRQAGLSPSPSSSRDSQALLSMKGIILIPPTSTSKLRKEPAQLATRNPSSHIQGPSQWTNPTVPAPTALTVPRLVPPSCQAVSIPHPPCTTVPAPRLPHPTLLSTSSTPDGFAMKSRSAFLPFMTENTAA